jgi:hypothetical protein
MSWIRGGSARVPARERNAPRLAQRLNGCTPGATWPCRRKTHAPRDSRRLRVANQLRAILDREFLAQDLPKLPPNAETASELLSEAV